MRLLISAWIILFAVIAVLSGALEGVNTTSAKYWDGEGTTNNWCEEGCINWNNDTCPGEGDSIWINGNLEINFDCSEDVTVGCIAIEANSELAHTGTATFATTTCNWCRRPSCNTTVMMACAALREGGES